MDTSSLFAGDLSSALPTLGVSTLAVAIAEIGDKTQLLALLLAARFRRPWPIIAGIFVATVLNHALAGWIGAWVASYLSPEVLRWLVAGSFLAIGVWTLIPDRIDDDGERLPARSAFIATTIAFFLAEIGDKTQIATVVLAAKSTLLWPVVLGTTLGMLLANVPVVLLGSRFAAKLPLKAARMAAAALFIVLALWVAWRGMPATQGMPATPAAPAAAGATG
jgi:putative Ca2+/H+ antiporter (TMEM165/GDT1 family)